MNHGSIKKIDELGRIVIPRDIRKSLSIKSNDSLEISIRDNSINISKNVSVKNYNDYAKKYAQIFSKCGIKILITNREEIIFNNTDITDIDVSGIINLSILELNEFKNNINSSCDIRPVIIDSNPEGIVIIQDSKCNELVGELFNNIITNELDITC